MGGGPKRGRVPRMVKMAGGTVTVVGHVEAMVDLKVGGQGSSSTKRSELSPT